jgi:hypothetical protein
MTALVYATCFLLLAALSGLVAASGSRWAWRLPLIAATPVLALGVWWQLSQGDGLPASSHPPDGSAFVAAVVKSPTPENSGAVFLWAQPPSSDTPRAYRLPYSSALEQQVAQAAKAARAGQRVGVRSVKKPSRGARPRTAQARSWKRTGAGVRTTQAAARGLVGGTQAGSSVLTFYRLTTPLPVKHH